MPDQGGAGEDAVEIGAFFDSHVQAIRSKDVDRLMSHYSADVVYFDVVPPLQFTGSAALRARFVRWFDGFDGPITVDTRDLAVSVGGEVAIAHWFSRVSGTLTNGRRAGSWVRVTSCCRPSDRGWLITHEHVSLPVDPDSGRAVTTLQP